MRQFSEAYGLEKSAISDHFIEASRVKLKDMMERPLAKMHFCAVMIDATPFEGQQMIAALGIGCDGKKTILGIRQGATENATVVGELLGDLMTRGLDFTALAVRFHLAARRAYPQLAKIEVRRFRQVDPRTARQRGQLVLYRHGITNKSVGEPSRTSRPCLQCHGSAPRAPSSKEGRG